MAMLWTVGFAVVSGLLLLGIAGLARHAWRTLPPGAQVPVHGGPAGWDRWRPKESALLVWPAFGTLFWLLNLGIMAYAVTAAANRPAGGLDAVTAALLLPMFILIVSEYLALRAARRRQA